MRTKLEVCLDCCCHCEQSRNYPTAVEELVVLKVAQVKCKISLNRKCPSKKYLCSQRAPALQQEILVSGLKGAFIREVP